MNTEPYKLGQTIIIDDQKYTVINVLNTGSAVLRSLDFPGQKLILSLDVPENGDMEV